MNDLSALAQRMADSIGVATAGVGGSNANNGDVAAIGDGGGIGGGGGVVTTMPDVADIFANFSTEMLQQASDALAHGLNLAAAVVAASSSSSSASSAPPTSLQSPSSAFAVDATLAVAALTEPFVNRTMELQCLALQQQDEASAAAAAAAAATAAIANVKHKYNGVKNLITSISCPVSFDSVLCWPRTPADTWAVLPCFEEFKGVQYDTTQNATRFCYPNGTWQNYTNYDKCSHAPSAPVSDFQPNVEVPAYIYCCGYFLSLSALTLALIIFLIFKDLRCLRNTIHANLFLTYILAALLWILTLFLQVMKDETSQAGCITLVIMFHYFNLTNFFWMFVEGLYLYTLVVQTFSTDNISYLIYAIIGWGCPALVVFVWSIAKIYAPPLESEHFNGLDIECAWMRESHIDWIFQGPASIVLLLNLIFLIRIMWVLITKLRSANTQETRQYHKASKALLVLIPLFGITYLLVLTGPEQGVGRNLFEILRASLISTQGFFVSIFFCFLNSEVRQTLRHRFDRWRNNRNLRHGNSQRNRRYRLSSKDYSQRSRTESLRLTTTSPVSAGHFE